MNFPFTIDQFLDLFEKYNNSVWPFQIFLNAIAVGAIILTIRNHRFSNKVVSAVLSFLWLWMGIVYHIIFFRSINPASSIFGIAFVIQGLLFLYYGVIKNNLVFSWDKLSYKLLPSILIVFSLLIYPIFGYFFEHQYPKSPTFGLPCPTTIFTLGFLLLSNSKIFLAIIPLLWCVIGFSAAFSLGMLEDTSLVIAGILFGSDRIFRSFTKTTHSL